MSIELGGRSKEQLEKGDAGIENGKSIHSIVPASSPSRSLQIQRQRNAALWSQDTPLPGLKQAESNGSTWEQLRKPTP